MDNSQQLNINFYTRFLMLNGEVTIPGVGKFELNRIAARHDVNHDMITAPAYTVRFNSNKLEMSSSQIAFLMKKLNLTQEELVSESDSFAALIMNMLQRDKIFDWPGVGKLTYSESGSIYFEGIRFEHEFLTSQPFIKNKIIDSTIEESSSEMISVDDPNDDFLNDAVSKKGTKRWRSVSTVLFSFVILILLIRFLYGSFSILQPRYDPIKAAIPTATYKLK
ncbi:MAG: hypothetical protein ACK5AO_00410 [bacterium]|jgi:hypothetical protein